MPEKAIVVIGAGPAGLSAIEALRRSGYEGGLVLVGEENVLPYDRPTLSKDLLTGRTTASEATLRPEAWFEENQIDLRLGCRATIDTRWEEVVCGTASIPARGILIATGARPRCPLGPATDRMLYLRDMSDALRIKQQLDDSKRLLVVGAGFIGAEVAASARRSGIEVTILEMLALPLIQALGPEIGQIYADIHRENGVSLRLGEGVRSIEEEADEVVVHTTKGAKLAADAVVVGVGVEPNADLAAAVGIKCDNGILVDAHCRTAIDNVLAAGDVANHWHPLYERYVRVEHYTNAIKQGTVAAATLLGDDRTYDEPHWFWSDQYDYSLQKVGVATDWDDIVVRGSMSERHFVAFHLKDGIVVSAVGINRAKDVRRAGKLIAAKTPIERTSLQDDDVDLRKLVVTR